MVRELSPPDKWLPVSIAPFDTDLEVCVIEQRVAHALVFPCRRSDGGWIDAVTDKRLDIEPSHWRRWAEKH